MSHGASFYCYGYVFRAMVVATLSLATYFAAIAYIDGSFVPLQVDIEFNVFRDSCFRTSYSVDVVYLTLTIFLFLQIVVCLL